MTTPAAIAEAALKATHTPGPWSWFGNARNNEVYLATTHSGRRYVMGFQRWGFRGAQPAFQPADRGLVPASDLFTFEVGDRSVRGVEQAKADDSVYRLDINGIDCADARLIAAAPDLLSALQDAEEAILHLSEDALGFAEVPTGEDDGCFLYPLRDELLSKFRAAIRKALGE